MRISWISLTLFCLFFHVARGDQSIHSLNPSVIDAKAAYDQLIKRNPQNELVDLKEFIPTIEIELRYAMKSNFMSQKLYTANRAYLILPAAKALKRAQKILKKQGYGIKVWDAYRPYNVTVKMWRSKKAPYAFLAPPKFGSNHNRGIAVDITLIDLKTRDELAMPTGFDDFSSIAHHNYKNLPSKVIKNRKILKDAMIQAGFRALSHEWWDYALRGGKKYPLLDIPIKQLSAKAD